MNQDWAITGRPSFSALSVVFRHSPAAAGAGQRDLRAQCVSGSGVGFAGRGANAPSIVVTCLRSPSPACGRGRLPALLGNGHAPALVVATHVHFRPYPAR